MSTFAYLPALVAVLLFSGAMIYASVMDVLTMTVSDRLVLALVAGFLVLAPLAGWSMQEIGFSLAAAAGVFFISAAFFAMGWLGGGDGKLATVVTLWVGAANAGQLIVYTTIFGGLFAVFLLLFKSLPVPAGWLRHPSVARLRNGTSIPYAVALGLAGLSVLPSSPWAEKLALHDFRLVLQMAEEPLPGQMLASAPELTQKEV